MLQRKKVGEIQFYQNTKDDLKEVYNFNNHKAKIQAVISKGRLVQNIN